MIDENGTVKYFQNRILLRQEKKTKTAFLSFSLKSCIYLIHAEILYISSFADDRTFKHFYR